MIQLLYYSGERNRLALMKHKSFDNMNCSLVQTLNIIGERWVLLILRDTFIGTRRFGQFHKNLGIARNILTTRLKLLVDEGIMEKCDAVDGAHLEYKLTKKGLDLQPVLLSMTHWGDKYKPDPKGVRLIFVERKTGKPIRKMSATSQDGRALKPKEIMVTPGSISVSVK